MTIEPNKMKIGVLGCKGTTLDLIHAITQRGTFQIDTVITISPAKAAANRVAFYAGDKIRAYCAEAGIRTHVAKTYTLTGETDQAWFREEAFDLLLVLGWERLLPDTVLHTLGQFACGMHGSAFGLPKGRGRSPMNWAILTGQTKFVTSLFRYTPGMDDGDVIGDKAFDITRDDDIGTLHSKNRIAMCELLHTFMPKIADGSVQFVPQPDENPTYYPKRTREDGFIDWDVEADIIHRLVRAVAPPYPGALTRFGETEVPVLAGRPYDTGLFDNGTPSGTILDISLASSRLVVKCRNGAYLVEDIGGALPLDSLKRGDRFTSHDTDKILDNIRQRYPDFVREDQKEI